MIVVRVEGKWQVRVSADELVEALRKELSGAYLEFDSTLGFQAVRLDSGLKPTQAVTNAVLKLKAEAEAKILESKF